MTDLWPDNPRRPGDRRDPEPPRIYAVDGGPWRGPSVEEWVAKIAAASTPKREFDAEGRFQPWIRREGAA